MNDILSSIRVAIASMLVCVAGYTALIWGVAQAVTPATAQGSLLTDASGQIIGSRLVAQSFTSPGYFWPRPSAVDYNAAGAGGSNLSPANPAITARASAIIAAYGVDAPIPADLVTASGAGLDPHISLAGALFQVPRVAQARGMDPAAVQSVVERLAFAPGGPLTQERIVNVLDLNLALDAGA
ncbi:potassium-transporting ATPase subunit C [Puniceibacterium antarcticum]|nr:potassium-transporting ATPase subunit C [Puniceibacterium antarcticum]